MICTSATAGNFVVLVREDHAQSQCPAQLRGQQSWQQLEIVIGMNPNWGHSEYQTVYTGTPVLRAGKPLLIAQLLSFCST